MYRIEKKRKERERERGREREAEAEQGDRAVSGSGPEEVRS